MMMKNRKLKFVPLIFILLTTIIYSNYSMGEFSILSNKVSPDVTKEDEKEAILIDTTQMQRFINWLISEYNASKKYKKYKKLKIVQPKNFPMISSELRGFATYLRKIYEIYPFENLELELDYVWFYDINFFNFKETFERLRRIKYSPQDSHIIYNYLGKSRDFSFLFSLKSLRLKTVRLGYVGKILSVLCPSLSSLEDLDLSDNGDITDIEYKDLEVLKIKSLSLEGCTLNRRDDDIDLPFYHTTSYYNNILIKTPYSPFAQFFLSRSLEKLNLRDVEGNIDTVFFISGLLELKELNIGGCSAFSYGLSYVLPACEGKEVEMENLDDAAFYELRHSYLEKLQKILIHLSKTKVKVDVFSSADIYGNDSVYKGKVPMWAADNFFKILKKQNQMRNECIVSHYFTQDETFSLLIKVTQEAKKKNREKILIENDEWENDSQGNNTLNEYNVLNMLSFLGNKECKNLLLEEDVTQ